MSANATLMHQSEKKPCEKALLASQPCLANTNVPGRKAFLTDVALQLAQTTKAESCLPEIKS